MSEKIEKSSTSAGELDQRDRRSQNEKLETETARFQRILRDEEIRESEAQLRDLIEGLRYLVSVKPAPWDLKKRYLMQQKRLQACERKLFHLRQRRLL